MLTCEVCGEELLLEEDMKTHLLLVHLESDLHCPLCFLPADSYDQVHAHMSEAHPEGQDNLPKHPSSTSASTSRVPVGQSEDAPAKKAKCIRASTLVNLKSQEQEIPPEPEHTGPVSGTLSAEEPETSQESDNSQPRELCSSGGRPGSFQAMERSGEPEQWLKSPQRLLSCPMCALVCSSPSVLQEHVELHLEEQNPEKGRMLWECPVCSAECTDSVVLQEHVELHLDPCAGNSSTDLKLAVQLQQEEEDRRRREEAWQEKEHFKKLQKHYGLDGSGGYRRQMEKTMEREVARGLLAPADFHCKKADLMESLASGIDDGRSRTCGAVEALTEFYQTKVRDCVHVWLCADTDHFGASTGDKGWGCGYRNFQMLLSSLHRTEPYASSLQEKAVPSIPQVQRMIEEAWKAGLDPQGASHFNQRLQGTRAWIGATDIYVLLTWLGVRARIVDFHQPTGPGDTHPRLFDWVRQYFLQSSQSSRLPPKVIRTSLPPLYLQHQGHSRTVVGVEQKKNGSLCLLLLDPGSTLSLSSDAVSAAIRHIRKFPSSLKHKQYQLLTVQGVLSAEDKQAAVFNSRTFCAERIP
ncbi:zinc finger-containing ubiquitin peptidase 1 isoform X2 [Oryzias melastigma]|uniref:zinc finger-containing ubiquitin peptidase 1 isoform X2 n=1 Tax=Oryzias melastigma TaxID=30732 RepID=UPI000CF7D9F4|nr:zinc finger-containing ubiquitin peptidase 1 isoform X2 [Oryzias melastigma]